MMPRHQGQHNRTRLSAASIALRLPAFLRLHRAQHPGDFIPGMPGCPPVSEHRVAAAAVGILLERERIVAHGTAVRSQRLPLLPLLPDPFALADDAARDTAPPGQGAAAFAAGTVQVLVRPAPDLVILVLAVGAAARMVPRLPLAALAADPVLSGPEPEFVFALAERTALVDPRRRDRLVAAFAEPADMDPAEIPLRAPRPHPAADPAEPGAAVFVALGELTVRTAPGLDRAAVGKRRVAALAEALRAGRAEIADGVRVTARATLAAAREPVRGVFLVPKSAGLGGAAPGDAELLERPLDDVDRHRIRLGQRRHRAARLVAIRDLALVAVGEQRDHRPAGGWRNEGGGGG